jgi:PIN domain nuclease of toxin-antitoxin system
MEPAKAALLLDTLALLWWLAEPQQLSAAAHAAVLRLRRLACCKAAHSGQLFSIWAAQEAKGC